MKIAISYILLSLLAIALGAIPAYLYFSYERTVNKEVFYYDQWSQSGEGVVGAMLSIVGLPSHDFGIIDPTKIYSHEFILENPGDKTLEIWRGSPSAGIVKTDLGPEKVFVTAGSSYPIEVSFAGKDVESELNASVIIKSNDARYAKDDFEISLTGRADN